jgi:UDP-glucuronate 4-epimerase
VVQGDVCDDALVGRLFAAYNFDAVAHLAAQAGVRYSIDHPLEYVRNNIECFVRLLEHLRLRPAIRFIYASSSSVYGSQV